MIVFDYKTTQSEKTAKTLTKKTTQKTSIRTITFAIITLIVMLFIMVVTIQNTTGRDMAPGGEIEYEHVNLPTANITFTPELKPVYVLHIFK